MQTISVELSAPVSQDLRETLLKNLYWTDRAITNVDLSDGDPPVLAVACSDSGDVTGIEAKLLTDVAEMLSSPVPVRPRVVCERRNSYGIKLTANQTFRELSARGWVSPELPGVFVYAGPMADLYHGLDRAFGDLAAGLGARQVYLPSLIGTDTLLRAGYLRGNAHMANYVYHIHEDRSAISRFVRQLTSGLGGIDLSELPTTAPSPEAILSPAACQPIYRMLSGRDVGESFVASGYVRCYRYESGAMQGLRRSREFGVREIVYVGSKADVVAFRAGLLNVCSQLLGRFELQGVLETAADPFFTDTSAQYRTFQLSLELKHELKLAVGENETVAAASVNYHGDHFGRLWDIKSNGGETAYSCCMGFGIDRWCLAIFAQYGFDIQDWPRSLREVMPK
jgi:seryl-tRNA synthetase